MAFPFKIKRFIIIVIALSIIPTLCIADDTDDGIPIDDNLEAYDKLKRDQNISYVIRHALTSAAMREHVDGHLSQSDSSYTIQGGIVLQPGSKANEVNLIYIGRGNTAITK